MLLMQLESVAQRAVDVSSGVELTAGKKDVRQIHDFIRATQLV